MNRTVAGRVAGGFLIAFVLALAGCGSGQGGEGPAAAGAAGGDNGEPSDGDPGLPEAITCGTQYRPDAEQMTGAESPTLTVDRRDDLAGSSGSHEFPNMTLEVTYWGDAPEGRTVMVRVTNSAGAPLFETLYQISTPLQDIQFAGGHGFTGLNYVYHEEAMLQVWCEASA